MDSLGVGTIGVLLRDVDLGMLARTVWGEARGEGETGWAAVAWVIRNRAEWPGGPHWWGATVSAVCLHPYQFSCWNHNDPNFARLSATKSDTLENYAEIFAVGSSVMAGDIPDPTGRASHYEVRGTTASWQADAVRRGIAPVRIGHHDFYRIGPG